MIVKAKVHRICGSNSNQDQLELSSAFKKQFETAAKHNSQNDIDKAEAQIVALTNDGASILENLSVDKMKYYVVDILEKLFNSKHLMKVSVVEIATIGKGYTTIYRQPFPKAET